MSAILEVQELRVQFQVGGGLLAKPRKLHAINGVSLSVARGEVLSIVGESGCGKSTLARAMLGIEAPTYGRILLDGRPISGYRRAELAAKIQPIFQDPYSSLNPRKTVHDLIAMPLLVRGGMSRRDISRLVAETMELVGLPRRMIHSYPSAMSGGQRQRVAIARAIITRPEVIICDEPTSALDVSVQAQILNLLDDLRRQLNLTYIFISHDLSVVNHISDRVAVIYLGRIVELGPVEDVLHDPRHPYTRRLRDSTLEPRRGMRLPKPVFKGGFPDPTNPPAGCHYHPRCTEAMPVCQTAAPGALRVQRSTVACHLFTGLAGIDDLNPAPPRAAVGQEN